MSEQSKPIHVRTQELAKREEEFAQRSSDIEEREARLSLAETTLAQESSDIEKREKQVSYAEQAIVAKFNELGDRERALEAREGVLTLREMKSSLPVASNMPTTLGDISGFPLDVSQNGSPPPSI